MDMAQNKKDLLRFRDDILMKVKDQMRDNFK